MAGRASALARRHGVYFQHVGVASVPESYTDRLTPLFADRFERLRLFELEVHDLVLSKLTRNHPVDREDVAYLAQIARLDPAMLRARYRRELRPVVVGDPAQHERTLDMWISAYLSGG